MKNKDIALYYFAGSGGFLFLHLLLLSEKFYCSFKNKLTFEQVLTQQWDIDNHKNWKDTECWPDNELTENYHTEKRKIFFYSNPTPVLMAEQKKNGKINVLLFTDLYSQIELALYKNAMWFKKQATKYTFYKQQLLRWRHHYNSLKAESWPECSSPKKFETLPDYIKQELLAYPYTEMVLNITPYNNKSIEEQISEIKKASSNIIVNGKNETVINQIVNCLEQADYIYKLQDIVNELTIIENITTVDVNFQQKELLSRWKTLHNKIILDNIGIKN